MIIYHGTDHILKTPEYGKGAKHNDYGRGFYCTRELELAKEWACGSGNDGFANAYEFDISGLRILDLNEKPYNILNWLAILTRNRTYWQNGSVSYDAKQYLQANFYVDTDGYYVIKGYRADDSYFSFAQDFVSNSISLQKLKKSMYLGELGEQIMIKSELAFSRLSYIEAFEADAFTYFEKKQDRDKRARKQYREKNSDTDVVNEIYMLDIMREEIKSDDPRLQ